MKVAIYSRGKRLAVREQPSAEAPIIGTMGSGCAAHVEDAAPGWLELTMGGYIREDLVTVGSLVDTTTYAIKEQPSELAKGSGVALPKNATKAQIIELLMGSDE